MNHAPLVGVGERVRDLEAVSEHGLGGQSARRDQLPQRPALDQLHGDEEVAAILPDLVDMGDVRMVERGGGSRLAHEPGPGVRVGHGLDRQQLDRQVTA